MSSALPTLDSHVATPHESAPECGGDRGLSGSASASRGALPPKLRESHLNSRECDRHSVSAALGCVPHGQWAPLDADMLELIDRSTCLVEPAVVGRAILLSPVLVQACTQRRTVALSVASASS